MEATSHPPAGQRKLSFLEDQEYRDELRRRDEEAAAAMQQSYQATVLDYVLFAYFCLNSFLMGGPLFNANAVVQAWKNSDTFISECPLIQSIASWCPEQAASAKVALLLFQTAAGATGLVGGVLVDLFSAPMCLLVAHLAFSGGAYFLQSAGTRAIYAACFLQGIAGELLLNSVLHVCSLFGKMQNVMLLILTLCHDLSVLVFPLLLTFVAPRTAISTAHEEFYHGVHNVYMYVALISGIIGTFVLPAEEDVLPQSSSPSFSPPKPVAIASTLPSEPLNVKPVNLTNPRRPVDPDQGRQSATAVTSSHQVEEEKHLVPPPVPTEQHSRGPRISSATEDTEEGTTEYMTLLPPSPRRRYQPRSLWHMRLTRQIRTPQFAISFLLFVLGLGRTSFYLNNNETLLEAAGDDGKMTQSFMWLMGLGALCSPLSWHLNDNWAVVPCLFVFTCGSLAMNVLAAIQVLKLQYVTFLCFVFTRASISPTMLTYIAHCFGIKRFSAMCCIIGIIGAFANFLNVPFDQLVDTRLGGDYTTANLIFVGLGVLCVALVLVHLCFPTPKDQETERQIHEVVKTAGDPAGRLRRQSLITAETTPPFEGLLGANDEDDWEDESLPESRRRSSWRTLPTTAPRR